MCGIAGYLAAPGKRPEKETVARMCDRLRHRGPDGHGYFCDQHVALGHRRLSIIDVEGGAQPLGNEDGTIQVVFNGEIYNFHELKQGLQGRGHRFRTNTDTEVLVHLYEEVGDRLPEYLNGMFAFAIWDASRRELFLARDRFGEKPLYYTSAIAGMRFCFASELKAFTVLPEFPGTVSPKGVANFVNFSYVPDPLTIYDDVFKLEPGHCLSITADNRRLRPYWKPEFTIDSGADFNAVTGDLRELAQDAVESRMISDVPLGGFLSGGVDSSSVVAFMALRAPESVKTFSIGFTNRQFDERYYARLVAERYHTAHEELVVTPSIREVFPTLVEHYDEPFADSSAIPTLYLSEMTRRKVTVALSGDGADELFGGYRRYLLGLFENRLRSLFPDWFRHTVIAIGGRYYPKFDYLPRVFRAKATLNGIAMDFSEAYYAAMSQFRDEGLKAILSPDLLASLNGYTPKEIYCDRFKPFSHLPALQQMQAVDLETYLPGDILVKVDRATMAHSLESRAPWLDHRIAELACKLPASFKVKGLTGKHVLKSCVSRLLPAELLGRKKMGFAVPMAEWFRSVLRPLFEQAVLRPEMEQYVNLTEVRRLWTEHQSGYRNHETRLWILVMLSCWDLRHRNRNELEMISSLLEPASGAR